MEMRSGYPQTPQAEGIADEENDWLFSCRCESAKPVTTLLTCLKASGTCPLQPVTVFVSPTSITFHVYGTARQSQASVDLQAGLFSYYHVKQISDVRDTAGTANPTTNTNESLQLTTQAGEFCVNLATVLECLFVLGTHSLEKTKLSMSYNIHTEIFKLELLEEDSGVLSTAAIPGMVVPAAIDGTAVSSSLALAFRSAPIVARIILKSHVLLDALQELEAVPGVSSTNTSTTCTVILSRSKGLEFLTVGSLSDCVITIPASSTCVSSIESGSSSTSTTRQQPARSYPMSSIACAMRGLEFAQETCLSINENGMIAIQHQIMDTVGQGSHNFVDFIMTCLLSNNNDDDYNDDDDTTTSRSTTTTGRGTQEVPLSTHGISQSQQVLEHSYPPAWKEREDGLTSKDTNARSDMTASRRMTSHDGMTDHGQEAVDDDDDLPPVSTIPLFGALETDNQTRSMQRRVRHRRRSQQSHNDESDLFENENENKKDDDESSVTSQPLLDVTTRVQTPPRRRNQRRYNQQQPEDDYDGSSSPELVYQ